MTIRTPTSSFSWSDAESVCQEIICNKLREAFHIERYDPLGWVLGRELITLSRKKKEFDRNGGHSNQQGSTMAHGSSLTRFRKSEKKPKSCEFKSEKSEENYRGGEGFGTNGNQMSGSQEQML